MKPGVARGQGGKQRRQENAEGLALLLPGAQSGMNSAKVKLGQELSKRKQSRGSRACTRGGTSKDGDPSEASIRFLRHCDKVSKICYFFFQL